MLSVTEAPVDLANAQVLTDLEREILLAALSERIAAARITEVHASDAGNPTAEVVAQMDATAAENLRRAIADGERVLVIADLVVNLG